MTAALFFVDIELSGAPVLYLSPQRAVELTR
jgi:hypothetical protein